MIQIIKGTYGLMRNGSVEAMTKHSKPFTLTEAREAELVAAGVAVKVDAPVQAGPSTGDKMAELRKAAAELGVDTSEAKSKKEVKAMIEAAKAAGATPEPEADPGEE